MNVQQEATKVAASSTERLTRSLRDAAYKAGWPSDIIVSLNIRSSGSKLYLDFPQNFANRIDDLEYGSPTTAPNPVLRKFMSTINDEMGEILSETAASMIQDLGVYG